MRLKEKTRKFYTRHFVKMELEFLFLVLGWVAIAVIAYTVYTNVFLTVKTSSRIASKSTDNSNVRFLFFSSSHCPWSKKARPQWDSFVEDLTTHPTTFGGNKVSLEEIDGDSHPDMLEKHAVDAYPTFKLIHGTKETTMTAMPSVRAFREFLIKSLGAEEHTKLPASKK